ncbi:Uncharacterized conserved protein YutE, UPF0331/DUF86 family [Fontimonas thermophila]|uniref:Uncharacterized conserved protein YutE, UPF0331/DUF86 family n=1 Tax=Fontimonas thermophila TaxID=1076937 RepID=A0A1I2KDZ3_9GAMM|nr:DUF86 domain-containing protein [Fontimonas thermophila]SFF64519.1 Uncharacterized conserved protein YutE, UPF0331/DUF86 family [Fontimonas thermophila]
MSVAARKIATLMRCVERARSEHAAAGAAFRTDYTRQDAALINVTRACEAAIDLANMLIRKHRLGVPAESRESFALLERAGIIPPELSARLQSMVGFRNIAIHQYQNLDLDIVETVIRERLDDLIALAEAVRPRLGEG